MSEQSTNKLPTSFYIISGAALVWNLLGVMAYVMQVTMTQEAMSALPEAERMLLENAPVWAISAFAIAVNGGALGCLLLLLRQTWAFPVLVASLVGVLVQMYHSFFIANSIEVYGPGRMIMPAMILVIAIFLVWYSKGAKEKGWIN
jgi:ABC-type transport system involved in cytochrome c biogenesis permease subunit